MLEMLCEGIIACFPAIQTIPAEETNCVIWVVWGRREIEASVGKLYIYVSSVLRLTRLARAQEIFTLAGDMDL
jgi:hypothetical protein